MSVRLRLLAFIGTASITGCSLFVTLDGLSETADGSIADATPFTDVALDATESQADGGDAASSTALVCNMTGLVAYWPLDEGAGLVANDCKGVTPGELVGAVAWNQDSPDDAGASVYFNGSGGSIAFPTNGAALKIAAPFTISLWMQADVTDAGAAIQDLAVRYDDTTGGSWGLGLEKNQKYYFTIFPTSGSSIVVASAQAYSQGVWRHVVGVIDASFGATLYVDGVSAGFLNAADVGDVQTELLLGVNGDGNTAFSGHLAKVAFFSRALSLPEISTLYSYR